MNFINQNYHAGEALAYGNGENGLCKIVHDQRRCFAFVYVRRLNVDGTLLKSAASGIDELPVWWSLNSCYELIFFKSSLCYVFTKRLVVVV
jgi:hypothetical protein